MCFCFVGLPFFPSASWPLSFLSLFLSFSSSSDLAWFMRECLRWVGLLCMDTLSCIHGVGRWLWKSACCMKLRSCQIFLLFSSCVFSNLLLVVGMDTCLISLILPYYLPTLCCSTTCCALTVLWTTRCRSFWSVTDNTSITNLQAW